MKRNASLIATSLAALALVSMGSALAQDRKEGGPGGPAIGPAPGGAVPGGPAIERGPPAASPKAPAARPEGRVPSPPAAGKGAERPAPTRPPQAHAPDTPRAQPQRPAQAPAATPPAKSAQPDHKGLPKSEGAPKNDKAQGPDVGRPPAKAAEPMDKGGRPKSAEGPRDRVQLSEQQRVNIHRDVLKGRSVNRVNVHADVRVGSRIPRSVRLAVLPAAVLAIAPAYRSYRYFVVDDRICIVEPTTYEIVDVITDQGQVAQHHGLMLSAQERRVILSSVDLSIGSSTLGLGALVEGGSVPQSVEVLPLPVTVTDRIPRLAGYKYFIAEQQIAIVDPRGSTIQALVEITR